MRTGSIAEDSTAGGRFDRSVKYSLVLRAAVTAEIASERGRSAMTGRLSAQPRTEMSISIGDWDDF